MKTVRSPSALDRATPNRLWIWAAFITLVGIAVRAIWFVQYEHELPFPASLTASGHDWANPAIGDVASGSHALTRSFAPGYGGLSRGLIELAGGSSATPHVIAVNFLIVQSGLIALATLLIFALARRVLFGWAALFPVVLITASIALIELAGGYAPQIPLMFLIVLAIWLITLLRERLPERGGVASVALNIGAGFTIGVAILFNPTVLLLAPFVIWWAFRGLGADHAVLLLVAVILLPASWLAVIQTQTANGIPTVAAQTYFEQDAGNLPNTLDALGDRVYSIATPWNARFARGSYASANWNYEWILPKSIRSDSNYVQITRGLTAFAIVLAVLLTLLGILELFAEGAGSAARLIALPVVTMPLATFLSPAGNILRVPFLPFLVIAATLGWIWLIENLKPYIRERRADSR